MSISTPKETAKYFEPSKTISPKATSFLQDSEKVFVGQKENTLYPLIRFLRF